MTPLEIINKWIESAHSRRMYRHLSTFWIIRDMLEGNFITDNNVKACIEFLNEDCNDTEEREILLTALKELKL